MYIHWNSLVMIVVMDKTEIKGEKVMIEKNYDDEISKKEKLILESEEKIQMYKEKIKSLKADIKMLRKKKADAFSKKFLDMYERGQVELTNENLEKFFTATGIEVPAAPAKTSHKKKAESSPGEISEAVSDAGELSFMNNNEF